MTLICTEFTLESVLEGGLFIICSFLFCFLGFSTPTPHPFWVADGELQSCTHSLLRKYFLVKFMCVHLEGH